MRPSCPRCKRALDDKRVCAHCADTGEFDTSRKGPPPEYAGSSAGIVWDKRSGMLRTQYSHETERKHND